MQDQPQPPLDRLFTRLDEITRHGAGLPDVADLLVAFASTERDYLAGAIAEHGDRSGTTRLFAPERGPRLTLAHRRRGEMSAIHSHNVFVVITPITGVETHRSYSVSPSDGDRVRLELIEERVLAPGHAVSFEPPNDVHAHGHVEGTGEPAYVLILAGDNQRAFERRQYDRATGEVTVLPPGEPGDWLEGVPGADR